MLKRDEQNTLNVLIKLDKRIQKLYKILVDNTDNVILYDRLKGLIDVEETLVDSFNIDADKMDDITLFLLEKGGINVDYKTLTAVEPHFSDTTYPYYRLYAKCKYSFYKHLSICLTLESMKGYILDNEVSNLYNFLLKDCSEETNNSKKREILKYAVFSLVDSTLLERMALDNHLNVISSSVNTLPFCCDMAIMSTVQDAIKKLNVPIKIGDDLCAEFYHLINNARVNEVIEDLFHILVQYVSLTGESSYNSPTFKLYVDYLKTLIVNSPKAIREVLYKNIYEIIDSVRGDARDLFEGILDKAEEEIENDVIPKVMYLSLASNKHKF